MPIFWRVYIFHTLTELVEINEVTLIMLPYISSVLCLSVRISQEIISHDFARQSYYL